MTNYKIYQNLPAEPINPQAYHLNLGQGKQQELLRVEERYKTKHDKYSRAIDLPDMAKCLLEQSKCSHQILSVMMLSKVCTISFEQLEASP